MITRDCVGGENSVSTEKLRIRLYEIDGRQADEWIGDLVVQ